MPAEWGAYVRFFYGPRSVTRSQTQDERLAFDRAWLHHQHANAHHWQHWLLREDSGAVKTLDMPPALVREMVADWMGAGRAITGKWEAAAWYQANAKNMVLSHVTQRHVEDLLGAVAHCHCGVGGSTEAACRMHGYCAAHFTPMRQYSNQEPANAD